MKWEAGLFQRHQKEVVARMKELLAEEDVRRRAEYLGLAYEKRPAEAVANSEFIDEEDATWDPIEDALKDEPGNYINMMRHFFWDAANVDAVEVYSPRPVTGEGERLQKRLSEFLLFCEKSRINRGPGTSEISVTGQKPETVEIEVGSHLRSRYRGSERMAH